MSRVLLEKLIVAQVVKKFPAFYGTRTIINVFTRIPTVFTKYFRMIQ